MKALDRDVLRIGIPPLGNSGSRQARGGSPHFLAHQRRRTLLFKIASSPGLSASELAGDSTLMHRTIRYHLLRLQEEGLISRVGPCYFLTERGGEAIERLRLLRSSTATAVLYVLRRTSRGMPMPGLTDVIGRNAATTMHYVRRLDETGLVMTWWGGKELYANLTAEGRQFSTLLAAQAGVRLLNPPTPVNTWRTKVLVSRWPTPPS